MSVWLLTLEKAVAKQRSAAREPSPAATAFDRGEVLQQERIMADDFMKPEIPDSVRELMKLSIEQAQRAFETFVSTSEKTWKSFEAQSQSARSALQALNGKIAEITRENAEASFALAMKLAESKDLKQALELQSEHAKKQMETFSQQLEAMRDLAAKLVQDAKDASAAAQTRSGPSPVSSSQSQSYRGSGSFTPRGDSNW
jgi:phasin